MIATIIRPGPARRKSAQRFPPSTDGIPPTNRRGLSVPGKFPPSTDGASGLGLEGDLNAQLQPSVDPLVAR
jgi:hypothetical protein